MDQRTVDFRLIIPKNSEIDRDREDGRDAFLQIQYKSRSSEAVRTGFV